MQSFTTQLSVTFLGDNKYVVISPLVFEDDNYVITIKEGFVYNGANIPPEMTSLIGCPMDYIMALSSCIHDGLYASAKLSRRDSDKIFYYCMISLGKNKTEALVIYKAVRLFGGPSYDKIRNADLVSVVKKV